MLSKKKLIIIFTAIFFFLNISFAVFYFFIFSPSKDFIGEAEPQSLPEVVEETPASVIDDEYYSIHFSYNDAVDLCVMEAESRNNNLIQLWVNERSSRFNDLDNMYMIKLDSHVGTPVLYDEKEHRCDIDPNTQGVAFYKEITKRKAVRPQ
ncbi:MAG: hypothetical protein ACJA0N_000120 [Pseudohongiellaceae bacterium]|jgi:hypothetical protein